MWDSRKGVEGVDDNDLTDTGRLLNAGGRGIDGLICGSGVVCCLQVYAHFHWVSQLSTVEQVSLW